MFTPHLLVVVLENCMFAPSDGNRPSQVKLSNKSKSRKCLVM